MYLLPANLTFKYKFAVAKSELRMREEFRVPSEKLFWVGQGNGQADDEALQRDARLQAVRDAMSPGCSLLLDSTVFSGWKAASQARLRHFSFLNGAIWAVRGRTRLMVPLIVGFRPGYSRCSAPRCRVQQLGN